jgi:natural product precursor
MKKISNLNLVKLGRTELYEREMNILKGGSTTCSCSCPSSGFNQSAFYSVEMYDSGGGTEDDVCACTCSGSSSDNTNANSNIYSGYGSSGNHDGNCTCGCFGSQDIDAVFALQGK